MPILAIRNQQDVARLIENVRTPFERDLLDTLVSWRFRYEQIFKMIQYTAQLGLDDSSGREKEFEFQK